MTSALNGVIFLTVGDIMTEKSKQLSLEESLKELEELVGKLEDGEINLDDTLQYFEKGVTLYKDCQKQLQAAEKRIKILTDELREKDFE